MNDVVAALDKAGLEVRSDPGTRGMYASDASLYRIPPLAVVRPRHVDEVAAALAVARATGTPLTSRGAGTSVAGNAVGRGIVLDFSRHLNRVLEIDPDARTAVVEPGTVHAVLQKAGVTDPKVATVILAHELIWEIAELLVAERKVERPAVALDASPAHAALADLMFIAVDG